MRFIIDHDLHIHSFLSLCSNDPEQNKDAILAYGERNGLKTLCLTDHMWDPAVPGASGWYQAQPYERTREALPLPQSENVRFLFGCETDMDRNNVIGISRKTADELDFIIVPTTHLHMNGFTVDGSEGAEERAKLWVSRFEALLKADLPFDKTGLAHMTCPLVWNNGRYHEVFEHISKNDYHRLFEEAARVGIGIELNFPALDLPTAIAETVLLPYKIAKEEGCKFYLGSDAHAPRHFTNAIKNFNAMIDLIGLTEDDKIPMLQK